MRDYWEVLEINEAFPVCPLNITSIFIVELKDKPSEILMYKGCLIWGNPCYRSQTGFGKTVYVDAENILAKDVPFSREVTQSTFGGPGGR